MDTQPFLDYALRVLMLLGILLWVISLIRDCQRGNDDLHFPESEGE